MKHTALTILKHGAFVLFELVVGLIFLETALRATGWMFLQIRRASRPPIVRQANHYRILCLGESTTADVDLLSMGTDSYPAQLERILNERSDRASFTVINGGVPATTTDIILEQLTKDLDRYRPDIVVTMIGINDGESGDPVLQISGHLRVWKLAKMLYYTFWNPRAAIEDKFGPTPPDQMMASGQVAWNHILAGRHDAAKALLLPMIEQDRWSVVRSRANGMMAVSSWQQNDDEEGERYHQRFLELERAMPRLKTKHNYRELQRILAAHQIPLVAVQYPGLPVDMLRQLVDPIPGVVFVDNERTFLQLVKTRPVRETYRDLCAGVFGHLTPSGNGLLAESVARGVLQVLADDAPKVKTQPR